MDKGLQINFGARWCMANGDLAKLRKSIKKNRIWKLWNGLEIIQINFGAKLCMVKNYVNLRKNKKTDRPEMLRN